ncbi:MAG: tRNA pseudouridine(13) synthase TruD [Porticoccaceae bacterium]
MTTDPAFSLDFARAHGTPAGVAQFRVQPEDFVVEELLDVGSSTDGEHLWLQLRKRDHNTLWVAQWLARTAGVEESAIGFCGIKDRRALTTQWFSVPLRTDETQLLSTLALSSLAGCEILQCRRQQRKLRRGMHRGNRFEIRLREPEGDHVVFEKRLAEVAAVGVPNYFGEQRFGIDGNNLREADLKLGRSRWSGKGREGLYLSAARSYLFNLVLSARVQARSWRQPLAAEVVVDGPLWGRGRSTAPLAVAELESRVLGPWSRWRDGLEHSGLRQERRELVCVAQDFRWYWQERDLVLNFSLAAGCYATAVLREIATLNAPPAAAVASVAML